jgi:hypothetical protein
MLKESKDEAQLPEALDVLNRAALIRESLFNDERDNGDRDDLRYTIAQRCEVQRKLKRVKETVADARKLASLSEKSADDLFNAACYFSWAAGEIKPKEPDEAARLCDQAVKLLERAFAIGPRQDATLSDPDLKSLTDHTGFKDLIERYPPPGK